MTRSSIDKHDIIWGMSALHHDAAISVVQDGKILFAAHAERYSKKRHDPYLNRSIFEAAYDVQNLPHRVVWYERPWLKKSRQLYAGQWKDAFSPFPRSVFPFQNLSKWWQSLHPERYMQQVPVHYVGHHHAHAAAGYYTSKFDDAAVLVIDAIGEWETATIWHGQGETLTKKMSWKYPHSLGLMYSAFTERCGFTPNDEEYIMMGLAAYGKPKYSIDPKLDYHRGIGTWKPKANIEDLAASVQERWEIELKKLLRKCAKLSPNLVYMGGGALNCVANRFITRYFRDYWIMPNPGDAGSSLGAILALTQQHIKWPGPYLGYNISGKYPIEKLRREIRRGNVVGVAKGKAEFGPRALGNRSLFADASLPNLKAKLNGIKHRAGFRPFGCVVREEDFHVYFDSTDGYGWGPLDRDPFRTLHNSYMQFTWRVRYPQRFPGITHVDGTSRVQTVNAKEHRGLYTLLTRLADDGIPILLNTSLNVKGQPIVNDERDAEEFRALTGIKVF